MAFYYRVYGWCVASELECPELVPTPPSEPDISIRLGEIEAALIGARHIRFGAQIADGVFQYHEEGIAHYRVASGTEIVVDPAPGAAPGDVRTHLLGTAFAALLHQRGRLPLHASAIVHGGAVIAFCGDSGAGKSTLGAALQQRGYRLACDDVGVVVPDTAGALLFYPGFPRIKLWNTALDHFGIDAEGLQRDLSRADKYHLQLHDAEAFSMAPSPLRAIYVLARGDGAAEISPLGKQETVANLIRNTWRRRMVRGVGDGAEHLRQCAAIANRVEARVFRRPWGLDSLDEGVETLMRDFEGLR